MRPAKNFSLPEVIDSTIIAEYVSCMTKGFYSFQQQLAGIGGSADLIAGGAFAKGIEVFRRCYYGTQKLGMERSLEQAMLAAIADLGDYQFPENKAQKGPDRIVQALAAYVEHFPPDTDSIQPHYNADGEPSVEYKFAVPIPITHPETGNPFIYAGRFDMLGVFSNQLVVVDEKTCSQLGPTWVNKWNLRAQFTGYVWACHQFGIPVVGAIPRGVRFTKSGFTSESFMQSIQMRAQWQLDAWYNQMLANVERMVYAWKTGWYDQDFGDTCAEYSGCPFQSLCLSPNPENWIEGKFEKRVWNPLGQNPVGIPEEKVDHIEAPELKQLMERS